MNKTATTAQNAPMQAPAQPKPAHKPQRGFSKSAWDLAFNFETVKTFIKFSAAEAHMVAKEEIAEALQAAKEILKDPQCAEKQKLEIRYLLFHEFAKISISTNDEEVRRAAEEARDSVPYPFSPKYGRVHYKP